MNQEALNRFRLSALNRARQIMSLLGFWLLVAYVGGAILAVAVLHNQKKTNNTALQIAKDEARHDSEIRSKADSDFARCVVSIESIHRYDKVVTAYDALLQTQIENVRAVIKITPPGPLLDARKAALANLQSGVGALQRQPNHTKKFCVAQRKKELAPLPDAPATRPT